MLHYYRFPRIWSRVSCTRRPFEGHYPTIRRTVIYRCEFVFSFVSMFPQKRKHWRSELVQLQVCTRMRTPIHRHIPGISARVRQVINGLNSGASTYMADFEDSSAPTWDNMVGCRSSEGHVGPSRRAACRNKSWSAGYRTKTSCTIRTIHTCTSSSKGEGCFADQPATSSRCRGKAIL